MSRNLFLSLVVLILLGGGVWFWWNSRPEQQVNRRIDEFLEAVRFEKLSLKKREDRHKAFQKIFASEVDFEGPDPFPNETYNMEFIIARLDELHSMITLCEIEELDRSTVADEDTATVELHTRVKMAAGPNFKQEQKWKLTFVFEKQDHWRIISMNGEPD